MKTQKKNNTLKSILLAGLAVVLIIPFTSCSKKITFLKSNVVPAAKGYVKVNKDNNQNYSIKVVITDLADVQRVQLNKSSYVVWMKTDEGNTENLGQLRSSTGFLSKQRTATLETVSPYKPVKVFVTIENEKNMRYPGGQEVLVTNRF